MIVQALQTLEVQQTRHRRVWPMRVVDAVSERQRYARSALSTSCRLLLDIEDYSATEKSRVQDVSVLMQSVLSRAPVKRVVARPRPPMFLCWNHSSDV